MAGAMEEPLDSKTESAACQGITVTWSSLTGATPVVTELAMKKLLQKLFEELRRQSGLDYDAWYFHVMLVQMPLSNRLRLEVGRRLTADESEHSILLTNATSGAYSDDGTSC